MNRTSWVWVRFRKPRRGHPETDWLWMVTGEAELGWRAWKALVT
jgi:hypothetical protein